MPKPKKRGRPRKSIVSEREGSYNVDAQGGQTHLHFDFIQGAEWLRGIYFMLALNAVALWMIAVPVAAHWITYGN